MPEPVGRPAIVTSHRVFVRQESEQRCDGTGIDQGRVKLRRRGYHRQALHGRVQLHLSKDDTSHNNNNDGIKIAIISSEKQQQQQNIEQKT